MRKNISVFVVFILTCRYAHSQVVILEANNPFPRVGDELEITYKIKKDTIASKEPKSLKEQLKEIREKELGSGTLKFTNYITSAGKNIIGPIAFTVNDREVKSNTITLEFDKPLPDVTSGIWIRQLSYEGQEYLVIEQRISGEWIKTQKSPNTTSLEFKSKSNDFVEIDEEQIDDHNIDFTLTHSTSKSQEVEAGDNSETVNYKVSVYKLTKTNSFRPPFKLDKSKLKYLPESQKDFEFSVK